MDIFVVLFTLSRLNFIFSSFRDIFINELHILRKKMTIYPNLNFEVCVFIIEILTLLETPLCSMMM